jgi:hypothetical protein
VRAVTVTPLDERNQGAHRRARSVLDCGGAPPLFRRTAENRIFPNAPRYFSGFMGSSVFRSDLPTTHEPSLARQAVLCPLSSPCRWTKEIIAVIETRAAFWTAAVLRRFFDEPPKIEFPKTPGANLEVYREFRVSIDLAHGP